MPITCTYENNHGRNNDAACFANLNNSLDHKIRRIFIEKCKFYFSQEQIELYLKDLQIYWDFKWNYNEEREEYVIDLESGINTKGISVTFGMVLRFLWEGHYKPAKYNNDQFIYVVEHYFKLREMRPKRNKLSLLCLACNCYLFSKPSFNTNHFPSLEQGCRILTTTEFIKTPVNDYFTFDYDAETGGMPKDPKDWIKANYNKLLKLLPNVKNKSKQQAAVSV